MFLYFQLILASLFWGTNIIVMKILLQNIPFLLLATLRVFLSCLVLGIYMFYKHIDFGYSQKLKAFWIGFLGIYLNFFLTFLGMREVKGIDNAFMNALAPLLTFVFAIVFLKQKGKKYEYVALVLSVFAFLLSIRFQIFSIQIGFFYLFLGLCLYMLSHILIQKWQLHQTLSLTFYQLFFGLILLSIHCFITDQWQLQTLLDISLLHWLLFLIVSGIGFAYIQCIYMKAVHEIGALRTSSFLSLNPVVTYVESLIFLHESFDWLHFISFLLIIFSLCLLNFYHQKKFN